MGDQMRLQAAKFAEILATITDVSQKELLQSQAIAFTDTSAIEPLVKKAADFVKAQKPTFTKNVKFDKKGGTKAKPAGTPLQGEAAAAAAKALTTATRGRQ